MKEEFEIRTMGFGELAQLYFPSLHPKSASNSLNRWIRHHPSLIERMKASGYQKGQRVLTPLQVQFLIEAFGPP
jgi:hypothetical protein